MGQEGVRSANAGVGQARRQAKGKWQEENEGEVNCGYLQAWGSVLVQVQWQGRRCGSPRSRAMTRWRDRWKRHIARLWPKGEVGIREKKRAPTLGDFADKQFLPWAESAFSAKRKTWLYYRNGVRRLKGYVPLASISMDDPKLGEKASGYVATRQAKGLQVASINRELQVLTETTALGRGVGVCRAGSQDKNA